MILIVIPTLNPDQGLDIGRRAQASAACDTRLVVAHDEKGQGFTKTANQGLRQRKPGEDICLLNDDITTFIYGWLKVLDHVLHANPQRGIVGPSGKSAGPAKAGQLGGYGTQAVYMLPFWCVLINHRLLDQIGYLNEELIHYSSDTLYCHHAKTNGWKVEWIRSVYLWHQHEGSGFRKLWRKRDSETFKRLRAKVG